MSKKGSFYRNLDTFNVLMDEKRVIAAASKPVGGLNDWLPAVLVRLVTDYVGIVILGRPFVIMHGLHLNGRGEEADQKCELDMKCMSDGTVGLSTIDVDRRIKLARGRDHQIPVDLHIPIHLLSDPKQTIEPLHVQLSTQKDSVDRVRCLKCKTSRVPWFLEGTIDLNQKYSVHFRVDLGSLMPCPECKRYYSQTVLKLHHAKCRQPRTCGWCHTAFTSYQYECHLIDQNCPSAIISCPCCKTQYEARLMASHVDVCPRRADWYTRDEFLALANASVAPYRTQ